MNKLEEQMKTSKTIPFDKKHIVVEKDTFDTMNMVIIETKKVKELQSKIEQVFNDINSYVNSYNSLDKENKKYQREIKSLKTRNSNLIIENNKLRDYINAILKTIKTFFRNLLQIGNEITKENVTSEIKDYYDNNDFNQDDVYDIANNTSKEDELFDYVGINYNDDYDISSDDELSL